MNNLAALSKMDNEAAKKFFDEAKRLIEQRYSEDALRHFLSTKLPSMFPSHPQWIYNHARLAQGNIKSRDNGGLKSGFVDVLLGATAIEYKKNGSVKPKLTYWVLTWWYNRRNHEVRRASWDPKA